MAEFSPTEIRKAFAQVAFEDAVERLDDAVMRVAREQVSPAVSVQVKSHEQELHGFAVAPGGELHPVGETLLDALRHHSRVIALQPGFTVELEL